MLLNDFYTIHNTNIVDNNLVGTIQFNQKHSIFEGHFPQQPVVPGVCMMQIIKELLEKQFQFPLRLISTGQVKFLQLITPELSPEVNISWKENEQGYLVNSFFKLDRDVFKLTGTYQQS